MGVSREDKMGHTVCPKFRVNCS